MTDLLSATGFLLSIAGALILQRGGQRTRDRSVAVVGLTCLDIHAWPVRSLADTGGVSFIDCVHMSAAGTAAGMAVTAAKLGLQVELYGCIGGDFTGTVLRMLMERVVGLNTKNLSVLTGAATSATVINVRPGGERPALHQLGASDQLVLREDQIHRICTENAFLHIGGIGLVQDNPFSLGILPLLRAAKTRKANVVITTMDLIAPYTGASSLLKEALPFVDYFMPSLEEAEQIAQLEGPAACGAYFLSTGVCRACVLKAGSLGSFVITRRDSPDDQQMAAAASSSGGKIRLVQTTGDSSCYRVFAFDINRVNQDLRTFASGLPDRVDEGSSIVDTTGCGDNYCAGFVAGLSRGAILPDACISGTAAAALCTLGVGSSAGNVNWDLIDRFCKSVPFFESDMTSQSTMTALATSGKSDSASGLFSPPPVALSSRLQKIINKVPDSDDEYTPVRGVVPLSSGKRMNKVPDSDDEYTPVRGIAPTTTSISYKY